MLCEQRCAEDAGCALILASFIIMVFVEGTSATRERVDLQKLAVWSSSSFGLRKIWESQSFRNTNNLDFAGYL